MGYRELLKKYMRHLEVCFGDNYVEDLNPESSFTKRDLAELRALAAEISRESYDVRAMHTVNSYNYRLRVLMRHHELSVASVAHLLGIPNDTVRRWRISPNAEDYRVMQKSAFDELESSLAGRLNKQTGTSDR